MSKGRKTEIKPNQTKPSLKYTLRKPYPFILTYPIHHPTLGTQTGRALSCASINPTLPWKPTYPYPFTVIPNPSTYPTLPIVGKNTPPYCTLRIYLTYPIHLTLTYLYPLHTFYYIIQTAFPNHILLLGLNFNIRPKRPTKIGRNDPGPKRLRPKQLGAETTRG